MEQEEIELWNKFNLYQSNENLNKLIVYYTSLVVSTARGLSKTLPQHIELDDLVSDGYFGLIDAIQKFDSSFGYKFETYASFRIRGEILDKLRVADWAPRALRSKTREIDLAVESLFHDLNRQPTIAEIANVLGWDEEEVHKIKSENSYSGISNIDNLVTVNGAHFSLSEIIPDLNVEISDFDFELVRDKLSSAFDNLNNQQKVILFLYYKEGISLKNIGKIFEVTESRACQIHTAALEVLWSGCFPKLS